MFSSYKNANSVKNFTNKPNLAKTLSEESSKSSYSGSSNDCSSSISDSMNASRRCECGLFHNDSEDYEVINASTTNNSDALTNQQQQDVLDDQTNLVSEENKELCDIFDRNLYLDRIFVIIKSFIYFNWRFLQM